MWTLLLAFIFFQTTPKDLSKTPYELIDTSFNFQNRAANGITLDTVVITDTVTKKDVTMSTLVQSPDSPVAAVVPMTNTVALRVKGGVVGGKYNIAIRVIKTDTGEHIEGDIPLNVVAAQQ